MVVGGYVQLCALDVAGCSLDGSIDGELLTEIVELRQQKRKVVDSKRTGVYARLEV